MTPTPSASLADRILGCWMGKSIGGTLGIPAEGRMERLHYTFYDPLPAGAAPNDDLELQLVGLHVMEQSGGWLAPRDFADAWREHIHYMYDEYGRCRWNLRRGVPPAAPGREARLLVALARSGARLIVDGRVAVDGPPGLPYVPATHRSAGESRARIEPSPAAVRRVRLELGSRDPEQDASVLLAYPDLHLCPWSKDELPHRAVMPRHDAFPAP